eukprot:TRINITY_DN2985_c0_g4_i3.p1 TRINITY_DN2985_c0_g4~~TRINITY_DN2985_c0_g4_i3.p1  ORF type:complete len:246 (-),score=5.01 TRINITY_DN2985_c0_g4_i3:1642-2379(-)
MLLRGLGFKSTFFVVGPFQKPTRVEHFLLKKDQKEKRARRFVLLPRAATFETFQREVQPEQNPNFFHSQLQTANSQNLVVRNEVQQIKTVESLIPQHHHNSTFLASAIASSIAVRRVQPILRNVANPQVRGPLAITFLFGMIFVGIKTLIVNHLSSKAFACNACHGYGIERCQLCGGMGLINWEGKFSHSEPCPLCCGKRYTNCTQCGGLYHRQLFRHTNKPLVALQNQQQQEDSIENILAKYTD